MINNLKTALRGFATCLLINNNLWEKSVSLSPITFDDSLKTTSVSFFIAEFSLLSCKFDSFTFKLFYCVIFILIKNKHFYDICIHKTFTFPCENSKTVSFASSRMKWNLELFTLSKFPVKLVCWIALGSALVVYLNYCNHFVIFFKVNIV